jgi:hypothetical protein
VSTWGRSQDALFDLWWGYEDGKGEFTPGRLHGKLTFEEIGELIEATLEAVSASGLLKADDDTGEDA